MLNLLESSPQIWVSHQEGPTYQTLDQTLVRVEKRRFVLV
jgi:hypothetical protein